MDEVVFLWLHSSD